MGFKLKHNKKVKIVKNPFKGMVLLFAAAAAILCLIVMGIVIWVDPFFHYHKPLKNFPYLVDNQLSQNPGMAAHMDYDSVILGSSMTVNFNTNWFKELMGLNTIKLSYSGAFPKDQSNIMKIIFESKNKVKKVFLGIDVITYTGGVEETKYPIPEYLYDDQYLNDINYLLNKDVLLNYILRPVADPDPTDLATVYKSWWTEEYYSEEWVLHNYIPSEPVSVETPAEDYLVNTSKNLDINICPFIEMNPDVKFVVFFPPYSILFWNDVMLENHLNATLEEYRYIAQRLNAYENVDVYFFSDMEDIILNLNNYADYSHYHPRFNRYMAECFTNETGLVKKEGGVKGKSIDVYIDHMKRVAESYNFDQLLDKK